MPERTQTRCQSFAPKRSHCADTELRSHSHRTAGVRQQLGLGHRQAWRTTPEVPGVGGEAEQRHLKRET